MTKGNFQDARKRSVVTARNNEPGGFGRQAVTRLRQLARQGCQVAVEAGLPPHRVGWRHCPPESVQSHVARMQAQGRAAEFELIHRREQVTNPLPFTTDDRSSLSRDAGWWGYSMHDVPQRISEETFIATIPDATIVSFVDDRQEYWPAILSRDGRAIDLREIKFRNRHAEVLRSRPAIRRIRRATWICERVYDNHSHWLTAHLPKLCMLQERGELGEVLLPTHLTSTMDASLRMMDLDPAAFSRFEPGECLHVEAFTFLGTDRFRPELLQPVRSAIAPRDAPAPQRRIYISRGKAGIRRLANEEEIWPLFRDAGFERVYMEEHDFASQVELMAQTSVLAAPHGAGMTNMMFCPPGAHILEIAWLGFPNPNFYAVACAMGHHYGLVPAEVVASDADPLRRDMTVRTQLVESALAALDRSVESAAGAGTLGL
ncbi:glycosyltransferase family 61 protein [Croceicoccus sp. F390]|uniref:Glycosyltransferase family 61 protein n=1 Tax=Croceicoccus esteveae TaxID=3075597 RepID=A0ABU2ZF06_9SPHN|nr:glycosyltransferase family 61 protein [Croceicoccus sp. F390]MDT0575173.1 glycosyltransferase family 61 protein [Croceicoccus sp. F390]